VVSIVNPLVLLREKRFKVLCGPFEKLLAFRHAAPKPSGLEGNMKETKLTPGSGITGVGGTAC